MSKIKHSHNRILEISDDYKQITLPDSRYYRRNGKYYPSVTYVLNIYPKGKFFEDWLKKVGYASEHIVKRAAEEGTQVHELCELYLNGSELNFLSPTGKPQYNPDIWIMFLRFVDFWEEYTPKLIETEVHLFSDKLEVAGTCDLIVEINDKLWLLDIKTSNQLHSTYELQTAVYGQCYQECYNKKVDHYGILWLKSPKRKSSKGKIQGKGWEVLKSERTFEENIDIFKTVKKLFDLENPTSTPFYESFRTIVKRKDI
jgi:hypothetical protein